MKVYCGPIIGRGRIEPDWLRSLLRLLRHPIRFEPAYNDALLCRARSQVATRFLESDCDVLLTIDSDIAFDDRQAMQLCEQADEYSLVGGAYVTRSKDNCFPTSALVNDERVKFEGNPTPVPVKWLASGFMAVHRRVFDALALQPDMPMLHPKDLRFRPFYLPMVATSQEGDPIYLSEDFALCERAYQAGFSSYLNPAIRLIHLGQYGYRLEDMLTEALPPQAVWLTRKPGGLYLRESAVNPSTAA